MSVPRRRTAALAATTVAIAATALAASPAFAAASGTAKVSGTTVIFTAAAGKGNLVFITRSGRTVTIDDRVAIKAGAGCKAVAGDKTKVKCTTKKNPKLLKVTLGAKDDSLFNQTAIASTVTGGTGADQLNGGSGADRLDGGSGADHLTGHGGNDVLMGGTGGDHINAAGGNDRLHGGAGADGLRGGPGADMIFGDAGSDTLHGDGGDDELWTEPAGSPGVHREIARGGAGYDNCYVPIGEPDGCESIE